MAGRRGAHVFRLIVWRVGASRKRERLLEIIRKKRMSRRSRRWWTDTPTGRWTVILSLYLLPWVGWKTAFADGWWGSIATYPQREWVFFAFYMQTSQLYGEEGFRHTLIGAWAILIHITTKGTLSQALTRWKMFLHKKLVTSDWGLQQETSRGSSDCRSRGISSNPYSATYIPGLLVLNHSRRLHERYFRWRNSGRIIWTYHLTRI
jgi:hypothetical protein